MHGRDEKREDVACTSTCDGVIEGCRGELGGGRGEVMRGEGNVQEESWASYVRAFIVEVSRVGADDGIRRRGNVRCQKQRCNLLLMKRARPGRRGERGT